LLEGKELSYNNLLDLDAAMALVSEFPGPACAVVKHNEPAGVGLGKNPLEAFTRAFEGDSLSAFGGVVAFNCEVDADTAEALARPFLECVSAPSFAPRALQVLAAKKNLRLVATSPTAAGGAGGAGGAGAPSASSASQWRARAVEGGILLQADDPTAPPMGLSVATRRAPTPAEMEALLFAWTVVAHARSNAIVIARAGRTLGVGSGQTSRIDAVEVALLKARRAGHDLAGAVLASDGFFPFGDWVEPARSAGITAAIQPGGSVRDAESIAACDAAGLAMVLTGRRQFRH
jgi:phosphoribosylaminoimidazolecarboxamide formyltransferase/IMP cyclohydrolase